jgi:HEPN domain-containing protein
MTRSDQARKLQRKAAQDLAVLDRLLDDDAIHDETLGYHAEQAAKKLIKALLALHGQDYRRSWPPLLHALYSFVEETIESGERLGSTI